MRNRSGTCAALCPIGKFAVMLLHVWVPFYIATEILTHIWVKLHGIRMLAAREKQQ